MGALLLVTQGVQIIGTLGPIAIDLADKLKKVFQDSDPSFEVQIKLLQDEILSASDATDQMIAEWKLANGILD